MIVRIALTLVLLGISASAYYQSVVLVGGHTSHDGHVVVNFDGLYGPICGDIDEKAANVACRELGYSHGMSISGVVDVGGYFYYNDEYDYDIHAVKDLVCSGNESRLSECTYNVHTYNGHLDHDGGCAYNNIYAYVVCRHSVSKPPEHFNISVPNVLNNHGFLRMTYSNITGMICANGWDDNSALVACRTIDPTYTRGVSYTEESWLAGWIVGPLWTSNVYCSGQEKTLDECSHTPFGEVADCPNDFVAGISCYRDNDEGLKFRTAKGNETSGVAQIFVEDKWQDLCHGWSWDKAEVDVLCKDLGYKSGDIMSNLDLPDPTVQYGSCWDYDALCDGTESDILSCKRGQGLRKTSFFHLIISCNGTADETDHKKEVSVKLMHGNTERDGVVMTDVNGKFEPVCHDYIHGSQFEPLAHFTNVEAGVVCRQLGYPGGVSLWGIDNGKEFHLFSDHNLSRNFNCTGEEKSLTECSRTEVQHPRVFSMCHHYAAVACRESSQPIPGYFNIQVYGHSDVISDFGFLKLDYEGINGVICADGFNEKAASLACQQMGYYSGFNNTFPIRKMHNGDPVWTSNLTCSDTDNNLNDCNYTPFGTVDRCDSGSLATVLCYHYEQAPQFRFMGTKNINSGPVEFFANGKWGQVCYDPEYSFDSSVMCRTLGFSSGNHWNTELMPNSTSPTWILNYHCDNVNATSIFDCNLRHFEYNYKTNGAEGDKCHSGKVFALSCEQPIEPTTTISAPTTTDDGSDDVSVAPAQSSSTHVSSIVGGVVGSAVFIAILLIVGFLGYNKYLNPDLSFSEMFGWKHTRFGNPGESTVPEVKTQQ